MNSLQRLTFWHFDLNSLATPSAEGSQRFSTIDEVNSVHPALNWLKALPFSSFFIARLVFFSILSSPLSATILVSEVIRREHHTNKWGYLTTFFDLIEVSLLSFQLPTAVSVNDVIRLEHCANKTA